MTKKAAKIAAFKEKTRKLCIFLKKHRNYLYKSDYSARASPNKK
jgi:hypothetical protein